MSRISSFTLKAPYFENPKKAWIYLPENYESGESFPVIYMQDGQDLFYDNLAKFRVSWRVAETMDELYHFFGLSAIVVAIESEKREREYMPWSISQKEKRELQKTNETAVNYGEEYADFLAKTLKPYVDKNFKTDESVGSTGIVGAGLGALAAVFAGLKYNYIFGNIGAFSTLAHTNEKKFEKLLREVEFKRTPSFYVYCGGKEAETEVEQKAFLHAAFAIYDIMTKRGARARLTVASDGFNHESRWGEEFGGFVKFFCEQTKLNKQQEKF